MEVRVLFWAPIWRNDMSYRIGIVGRGFVGGAMYENFKDCFDVAVWDSVEEKRTLNSFESFVDWSDIIFVCVPTPMKDSGECDISIVEDVVGKIANLDRRKYVVIKSTVTPGTTSELAERHNMVIGFNPEFLTEANAYNDFRYQPLIILGTDDTGLGTVMAQIYYEFNAKVDNVAHVIQRSTKEAELFKYLANSFLATKVIFANEFKKLCDKVDVDYGRIAEVAVLDKRLGHTHWRVPGPDGKLGFGGSCFPKDTSALISYADTYGTTLWLLTEASYINDEIREGGRFEKLQIVDDGLE
jgi:nucleotide sugar dehydrogenase